MTVERQNIDPQGQYHSRQHRAYGSCSDPDASLCSLTHRGSPKLLPPGSVEPRPAARNTPLDPQLPVNLQFTDEATPRSLVTQCGARCTVAAASSELRVCSGEPSHHGRQHALLLEQLR